MVAASLLAAGSPLRADEPPAPEQTAPEQTDPGTAEPVDEAEPAEPQDADSSEPAVGYADVQPIFARHCVECHGPEERSGGLRLDTYEGAARGGDSGQAVLDAPLEENELYARVSSSDRTYRMPKNADPLSAEAIETLRRWVESGTPWPRPTHERQPQGLPFYDRWLLKISVWLDRYEFEYDYAYPYFIGVLVVQLVLLVVFRVRAAYRKGRPWATGRLARLGRFSDGIGSREVALVTILCVACVAIAAARGHILKLRGELAAVNEQLPHYQNMWSSTVYGFPPRPIRQKVPKAVSRTYYRGNCERNDELFNRGDYLTATFRVSLCDAQRQPLEIGDAVPADGIFVRIEIERAPGTTEKLFSEALMSSVMLVKNFYEAPNTKLTEEVTRLETLKPDWHWVAYVPVEVGSSGGDVLDGTIYIYAGQIRDGMLDGTPHYGVEYALTIVDGKLTPESDLWMDSFGNNAFEPPARDDKLPYDEWFSERSMPVITGKNSSDPTLLGVDEYVEKGLIGPPEAASAEAPPPGSPTPEKAEPSGAATAGDEDADGAKEGAGEGDQASQSPEGE